MNGFKFDFSKRFWGGAHRAPSPDPSPAFSRASPSVWASPSILGRFAPSTRASPSILGRFAPSIRASPLTFDWGPWFAPPQNKFLDPPWLTPSGFTTNRALKGYNPSTIPHRPHLSTPAASRSSIVIFHFKPALPIIWQTPLGAVVQNNYGRQWRRPPPGASLHCLP